MADVLAHLRDTNHLGIKLLFTLVYQVYSVEHVKTHVLVRRDRSMARVPKTGEERLMSPPDFIVIGGGGMAGPQQSL